MPSLLSSLRFRLVLLILFAVLPALGLILYSAWNERARAREHVRHDAARVAELAVLQQEQLFEGSRQVLVMVSSQARGTDMLSFGAGACERAFGGLLTDLPAYANLGIALPSGDVVCSAVPMPGPTNVADRSWFQEALSSQGLTFGEYQIGRITGEEQVNLGYPIRNEAGELKGVAFAALRLAVLNDELARIHLDEGSAISITDRSGTVLGRYPDPEAWTGKSSFGTELGDAMASRPSGGTVLHGFDGVTRLYAFDFVAAESGEPELLTAVGIPEGVAFAAVENQLRRNLVALGVVALLALGAAWFGSDLLVLRRLQAILAATSRLRAGDLTARTGRPADGSELGQLGASFDAMADALENREKQRAQAAADLQKTATELAQKNEELEAFTYSVSHDLKEPLRTLEAFSQFLLEDYSERLDQEGRDYLERISKASVRMKQLIDDLLTLSRLSRQPALSTRVSVPQIVKEICDGLQTAIQEKNAIVEVDPEIPEIVADPARIEQIFANLIVNGLKFNDSKVPTLKIGADNIKDGMVTLFVRDNGIGIAPEYQERIFGVFQRLHAREDYEGTGAGLAIVKRATEASGGQVSVESKPAAGATFYVTLPVWNEDKHSETKAA